MFSVVKRYFLMNIIIIGFKGCGKTLIGKILADRLKSKFHDIDTIIESIYSEETEKQLSFRDIYKKHGNEYFRNLEKRALEKIQGLENSVISFGGGTVFVYDDICKKLTGHITIYLHVEPKILYERMIQHGIPAFLDRLRPLESFEILYAERLPTYKRLADIVVDNSKGVEDTIKNILQELSRKDVWK